MKHVTADDQLKILIASPLEPELVDRIRAQAPDGFEVVYAPELLPEPRYPADHTGAPRELDPEELDRWHALLADADVLFDFDWNDRWNLLQNARKVRWVQATSSGIGRFLERTGMGESGVAFTTAAGVHAVPLAEFAVLGLLYFTKGVPTLQQRQQERRWERYATRQLRGGRVTVVGLGAIGREVARLLHAHGVDVVGTARTRPDQLPEGVTRFVDNSELADALQGSDAVVLACPHTDQTHHLIAEKELDALGPEGVLVNIARGPVVDEAALIEALQQGRLGGAFLDVFEEEPPAADNPLWQMDNVLVSPHSASTVTAENGLIVDLFIDNLHRFAEGRPMRNQFDPSRSY